jgi:hypothetical protein
MHSVKAEIKPQLSGAASFFLEMVFRGGRPQAGALTLASTKELRQPQYFESDGWVTQSFVKDDKEVIMDFGGFRKTDHRPLKDLVRKRGRTLCH